ncbi:MAG TPA: alpha/beta hydrolase [Gemmatales bacterium]|nr:alpha/beta hydrolase [Gemmatales bacterium]
MFRDISYAEERGADPEKHKLDLYLPQQHCNYPVLVFVHGVGWSHGDKNYWFDLYGKLGQAIAKQGIGVAVINYRLSPHVKNPEQAFDVAQAIKWVHRNISNYGGNLENLFLAGHSAGGQLVSLVATDPTYLARKDMRITDIRGVISISGVYDVTDNNLIFERVFGKETYKRELCSPIHHVKEGLPPFLILHAERELPYCDGACATHFYQKLKTCQVPCQIVPVSRRDHMSILACMTEVNDPALQVILQFIHKRKQ